MKTITYILLFVLISSCNSTSQKETPKEKVIETEAFKKGEYQLIRENLFVDKKGNIYFRTIDRSHCNTNREVYARYSNQMYYDTIINNDSTFIELELKKVIDTLSFKRINSDRGITYYSDKNHNYFLREMAEGGTLHCTN